MGIPRTALAQRDASDSVGIILHPRANPIHYSQFAEPAFYGLGVTDRVGSWQGGQCFSQTSVVVSGIKGPSPTTWAAAVLG